MIDAPGTVMTDRGKALQAKVQAGATLQYTRIAFGSGRATDIAPLNALVDERLSIPVQPAQVLSDTTVRITGVLTNDGLASGFRVNEIGVFAQDPDDGEILYAYTAAIDESSGGIIPAGGGATRIEQTINLIVAVSDADTVIISAVGTDAYVMWEFFRLDQERQDREFAEDQARQDAEIASLWSEKANRGAPQEFNLPLASTIRALPETRCIYSKDEFNRVHVNFGIWTINNTDTLTDGAVLCVLPTGFRPYGTVPGSAAGRTAVGVAYGISLYVEQNGNVLIGTKQSVAIIIGSMSFIAQ